MTPALRAADVEEWRERFGRGEYEESLEAGRAELEGGAADVEWRLLVVDSLLALGRYEGAVEEVEAMLRRHPTDVRAMMRGHDVFVRTGDAARAEEMLSRVNRTAGSRPARLWGPTDLVALGRAALELGAEPRLVLEGFFDRAKERDPDTRGAYLAGGELALEKHDYQLAAEQYRAGIERFGDDVEMHYGLARAYFPSDREQMVNSLDAALHLNPRHVGSLLLRAEHRIDAEEYEAAGETLDRVDAVNPSRPEAWAYRAVLAHLDNDAEAEAAAREKALEVWARNPEVDHLVGRKLSQKYRFAEGAEHQRRALRFDADYLPAKTQLAQDLLRLGEEEGWELIEEVHEEDAYNVTAYNLVTLQDHLAGFETLEGDGLIVRMAPEEAAIYGDRVVELLERAKSVLGEKYGLEPDGPVTVEIYPDQRDFAIRTFGMPGGIGYLGVCFGNVITANSPASTAATVGPVNWRAVLWHEFCHVITLHLTDNKMPRWLSEGISVYEELERDASWGQRMTPQYREMILGGELTPVGELSGAFLNPPSGMHLQFAYYESALVVEFLIERYGLEGLRAILADLGDGTPINEAIEAHAAPMSEIEAGFEAFARERAEGLAPEADWSEPEPGAVDPADLGAVEAWVEAHPENVWGLTRYARGLLANRRWGDAKGPLEKLIEVYPGHAEAYRMLAAVHRELGEVDRERAALETLAGMAADAIDAYGRLMEIASEEEDWEAVARNAERYLAVNPLPAEPYRYLGRASENLGRADRAVASYRRLLMLDPADPAEVHFRLARLLHEENRPAAKRHALDALAEAPRYREAHRLLLEIVGEDGAEEDPP